MGELKTTLHPVPKEEQLELRNDQPNCCSKCRFWEKHDDAILERFEIPEVLIEQADLIEDGIPKLQVIVWKGDCKRHSPVIDSDDGFGVWPTTNYSDWCGDYESLT